MRRHAVILALVATLACREAPRPRPSPVAPSSGTRHNVLLITIDTVRADHLSAYGYKRRTSPHLDALASEGTLFTRAYTYWPKTRGSMTILMSGKTPSQNGYSKTHPVLLPFNPTLASVLQQAGYTTAAVVDNFNVAAQNGFDRGFNTFDETWRDRALTTESDRAGAITRAAARFFRERRRDRPFFLWLHYVNPHAPYTPPAPFDTAFLDAEASGGPHKRIVNGYSGGIPKQWAVPGHDQLGYYVAQYDGEIAAADREVGKVLDALRASGEWERTAILLTSDHGESLGEHDYTFDHGHDLFDPCLSVPMILVTPGGRRAARSDALASTLDVVPTLLDAVKVSYPPDLAGRSLLPAALGGRMEPRDRLFAQNERNMSASLDARYKLVATPEGDSSRWALYDRERDPGELANVARRDPDVMRVFRRELELFWEREARGWEHTRRLVEGAPAEQRMSAEGCENLRALGYVDSCR